jgi:hypothetical protein
LTSALSTPTHNSCEKEIEEEKKETHPNDQKPKKSQNKVI